MAGRLVTADRWTELIRTFVVGTPAPQGSKRHVGGGRLIESSAKVKPWREAVAAELAGHAGAFPDVPVHLDATFVLRRPKGHWGTGRNVGQLRATAPMLPGTKPDLDKLLRALCDALVMGGVIGGDQQITSITAAKRYANHGAPTGVWIELRPDDSTATEITSPTETN